MIRLLVFFIAGCMTVLQAVSQSFPRLSYGGSVHGMLTGSFNGSSSGRLINGSQTYSFYADSVSAHESSRTSLGASVWVHQFLSRKWGIQTGLSYVDVGHNRTQSNIQYMDPLYPGIGKGKLLELSSGSGEKKIVYSYRYRYLQIPVLAHYELFSSKDFYYKVSMSAGLGVNVLLQHQITAKLEQFVVDGNQTFQLDSSGFKARTLTFNAMLGMRGEYRFDKKTIVYLMPVFSIYPISVSSNEFTARPYYLQFNLGVQYAFSLSDERRR